MSYAIKQAYFEMFSIPIIENPEDRDPDFSTPAAMARVFNLDLAKKQLVTDVRTLLRKASNETGPGVFLHSCLTSMGWKTPTNKEEFDKVHDLMVVQKRFDFRTGDYIPPGPDES
jgi:hypothetical protein